MASKSIGMLNIVFGADLRGFERAMKKAQKGLKKFGTKMKKIGGNLSRNVTMPLLAVGGASAKMALDFQKSMTKINTLVGVSAEEVEKLKKSVLALSGKTATAPNELAEGLYFLTSAGLNSKDAMEALEQVSKGVASGLGESADLSNVAAAAQNAYGKETMSASKALDIFGGMVKTGMFNASELASVLGTQLGLSASLGISFEEVGAMISTYTKTTGDANAATTGLSGVMMSFAKITPKQETALNAVGLSAKSLRDMLSKQGLQGTLLEMQKRFKANGVELSEFFSKSQSLKAVLGVLGNQTGTYKDILLELEESVGFVNDAFDETAETPAFKMEKAMNDLRVAGTMLGEELFPIVDALSKKISSLTNWFKELDDAGKKNVVKWGLITAAIGPVIILIGKISTGISALIPIVSTLTKVMLANPYLAVGAAVAGLIIHFSTLGRKTNELTKAQKKYNTELKKVKGILQETAGLQKEVKNLDLLSNAQKKQLKEKLELQKAAAKEKQKNIEVWARENGLIQGYSKKINDLQKTLQGTPTLQQPWILEQIEEISKKTNQLVKRNFGETYQDLQTRLDKLTKGINKTSAAIKNAPSGGDDIVGDGGTEGAMPTEAMPIIGLSLMPTELPDFKPYGDLTRNEFEKISNDIEAQWEESSMTMEEQTAYTMGVMIENFMEFGNKVKQVMSGIGDVISATNEKEQAQFDIWRESQEEKTDILDGQMERELERVEESGMSDKDKADAKIAIEERYAEKKGAIDDMIDKKEKALKRKQAIRDKAMAIVSAIISTAEAIMGAVAASPLTGGLPWSALVAALGAAQILTIASTPIPFAQGGLVSGPTLGLIGEGSGTSAFNPEVVSPLDKLMGMMGTSNVNVHGRIQGDNIVLVSDKAEISRERFI